LSREQNKHDNLTVNYSTKHSHAQDKHRGTDIPAGEMAHAFQRGGAIDFGKPSIGASNSGKKRKDREEREQRL
jgi:hypothetical protein